MLYINTQTLECPITEYQIRQLYPNVSFPTPFVAPEGFAAVQLTVPPAYDWVTQGLREITPVFSSDVWQQTWEVYALTPEQIASNEETQRDANKAQSSALLQQTDWTENASVRDSARTPHLLNGDAFDDYRTELRLIALNPPIAVDAWPEKPEEVWSSVEVPA